MPSCATLRPCCDWSSPAAPTRVSRCRVCVVQGRMTELRGADLALTVHEAGSMFALAGLTVAGDQVAALQAKTEGWAAGLRLAALLLQTTTDVDELVQTFAGDEHSVADYLVDEVLQHQPAQIRDFLLRTSVADPLSVRACRRTHPTLRWRSHARHARAVQRVRLTGRRHHWPVSLPPDVRGAAAQPAPSSDARSVQAAASVGRSVVRQERRPARRRSPRARRRRLCARGQPVGHQLAHAAHPRGRAGRR